MGDFNFLLDTDITTYERSVMDIWTIISLVGGFFELLDIGLKFLFASFVHRTMYKGIQASLNQSQEMDEKQERREERYEVPGNHPDGEQQPFRESNKAFDQHYVDQFEKGIKYWSNSAKAFIGKISHKTKTTIKIIKFDSLSKS